ncbi:WRKY Transcription Factor, partial [Sarracenia purpurea var. burkii]
AQILAGNSDYGVHGLPESRVSGMEMGEVGVDVPGLELGVGDREVSARFSGGGGEVQPMDVSASGGGSISQRPRRR